MDYIEAPEEIDWDKVKKPTVFLAGGVTNCSDWQTEVVNHKIFDGVKGTFINPRRKYFDVEDKKQTPVQIKWEYEALQKVDIVSFWFAKETIQPIVLYELGYFLGKRHMHNHNQFLSVAVHKDYPRKLDVKYQLENSLKLTYEFDDILYDYIITIINMIFQYNKWIDQPNMLM